MPNWCHCELEIAGDAARVNEFLGYAKGTDDGVETLLDFNRFVPYPPAWRGLDREFERWLAEKDFSTEPPLDAYSKWGYSWCIENWGTNGNARDAAQTVKPVREGELVATIAFHTPWTEPAPVVLVASGLFQTSGLTLGTSSRSATSQAPFGVRTGS